MSHFFQSREWMDRHMDPIRNCVSEEFMEGIEMFLAFACNQESYRGTNTMLCPCARCKNRKQRDAKTVSRHLFRVGFTRNYYVWSSHGESCYNVGQSSGTSHFYGEELPEDAEGTNYQISNEMYASNPFSNINVEEEVEVNPSVDNVVQEDNEEYHDNVFRAYEDSSQPLYDGCPEGISQLYLAS